MVVDEVLVVVLKALHRDRVQQPFVEQTKLFLQLFTLVEVVFVEVFTASPRDRAPQRIVEQISSFLQLFTVVAEFLVEVVTASPRDRALQRFVEHFTKTLLFLTVVEKVLVVVFTVFLPDTSPDSVQRSRTSTSQLPVSVHVAHGVLRSRTSTFLFVAHALMVVFKILLQDRVPLSELFLVVLTICLHALAQCSWLLGIRGLASSEPMMASACFSNCLLGSTSRLAVESPFALRRGIRVVQPMV